MAVGGAVMMLDGNKWNPAKVIAISWNAPRSWVIKTPEGYTYYGNRQQLKRASNDNNKATHIINEDYLLCHHATNNYY